MTATTTGGDEGLFERLKATCQPVWETYTHHAFVKGMQDGSLPEAAFRYYLAQDYLFLIHFARAYALAVYKADNLEDMRAGLDGVKAILDVEMDLHVEFCAGWGLTRADMETVPEDSKTVAYTRYVLERGQAGDLLDLHVALAPCVLGYGEIGERLKSDPTTRWEGNPYTAWIEMYAGEEYQAVAAAQTATLDRLMAIRGGPGRFDGLARSFEAATRLEADFWQMGLDAAD